MSVTPEFLLRGAAYSLEQSGLLLRDANALYRSGAYASAVVLAAFAWEELGKWKMLRTFRREVIAGSEVTLDQVRKACRQHEDKLSAGMAGIVVTDSDEGVEAFKELMKAEFGSPEFEAADQKVRQLTDRRQKELPGERFDTRMTALYVDAASTMEWRRPTEKITKEFAMRFLRDAANDYSRAGFDRYGQDWLTVEANDPELAEALKEWTDRPTVLPPEWPTVS
jgi:AbiV family abortive infection protein